MVFQGKMLTNFVDFVRAAGAIHRCRFEKQKLPLGAHGFIAHSRVAMTKQHRRDGRHFASISLRVNTAINQSVSLAGCSRTTRMYYLGLLGQVI